MKIIVAVLSVVGLALVGSGCVAGATGDDEQAVSEEQALSEEGSVASVSEQVKPTSNGGKSDERPGLTASACKAQGGKVIVDVGDGAIHRPDYRCPESGQPPIGSIVAEPGGPVAVEGAVCCR